MTTAVVTLDEVRDWFDTDASDDKLQTFIDGATEVVESMVGAIVGREVVDWLDGSAEQVMLSAYPVQEITEVVEYSGSTSQAVAYEPLDGAAFTAYGFMFSNGAGANGLLTRTSSGYPSRWANWVKVTYTVGLTEVPARYRLAVLEAVRLLYTKSQGMGATEYPVSLSQVDMDFLWTIIGRSQGVVA